jgi:arginase family enzyme
MPARPIHRFGTEDRHFRGARQGDLASLRPGDIALFGLVSGAEAARAIRDASWFCAAHGAPDAVVDLGDAEAAAHAVAAEAVARDTCPYLLGGGNEDAAGVVRHVRPSVTIALAPRLDLAPETLARGALLAVGVHDLVPMGSVRAWRAAGGVIVPAAGPGPVAARALAALEGLDRDATAALVLDLGVADTGHAAGSATLNVGGMSAHDLLGTLRALATRLRIVAMATIGLSPERDPRGHSELLAAEALALASLSARRTGSGS